jgi:TonB family protein
MPPTLRSAILISFVLAFPAHLASAEAMPRQLQLSPEQQSQLHDLASRVLKYADSAGCKKSCTILVANFTGETGSTSTLSMQLADEVSAQLASQAGGGIQIASRRNLQQYLEKERIPSKLLEDDNAARWLATENGATVVLVGYLKVGLTEATLLVQLLDTKDFAARNAAAKTRVEEAVFHDIGNLGGLEPAEPFAASPKDLVGETPEKLEKLETGAAPPHCAQRDPDYTDAARRVKFKGNVVLQAVLSKDGQIVAVQPLKGAPYGLNQSAERAVRQWRCQPATKDGQPIAVLVPIESTFRIF